MLWFAIKIGFYRHLFRILTRDLFPKKSPPKGRCPKVKESWEICEIYPAWLFKLWKIPPFLMGKSTVSTGP